MMDDVLVEIDTYTMEVSRQLPLTIRATHQMDGTHARHMAERAADGGEMGGEMGGGEMGGMEMEGGMGGMMDMVKPTWATAPTAAKRAATAPAVDTSLLVGLVLVRGEERLDLLFGFGSNLLGFLAHLGHIHGLFAIAA